jgi:hypothetical protein
MALAAFLVALDEWHHVAALEYACSSAGIRVFNSSPRGTIRPPNPPDVYAVEFNEGN